MDSPRRSTAGGRDGGEGAARWARCPHGCTVESGGRGGVAVCVRGRPACAKRTQTLDFFELCERDQNLAEMGPLTSPRGNVRHALRAHGWDAPAGGGRARPLHDGRTQSPQTLGPAPDEKTNDLLFYFHAGGARVRSVPALTGGGVSCVNETNASVKLACMA